MPLKHFCYPRPNFLNDDRTWIDAHHTKNLAFQPLQGLRYQVGADSTSPPHVTHNNQWVGKERVNICSLIVYFRWSNVCLYSAETYIYYLKFLPFKMTWRNLRSAIPKTMPAPTITQLWVLKSTNGDIVALSKKSKYSNIVLIQKKIGNNCHKRS